MAIGVVGRKAGMTRIFTDEGNSIPVTVIQVDANRITEIKTPERDGYRAVQVTTGTRRANRITKPEAGHFAKNGVEAGRSLWEFRLEDQSEDGELQPGSELDVSQFENGQSIDVTGQSKGKGFSGTVKRWNFSTQDKTHGNSLAHRAPGSIGQCQSPGRVFKGKKMSGQMGNARVTSQNIEIVRVDAERNLLLVKGPVPGANGGDLIIKPAVKA
ncbi:MULTISPECIES: 50S ribosomal protein L3 [Halomonadaceae]|uniref:Large ribosomal subunit protein uL3 n=1 Tax=Vreelandella halophila TaxID=86177 RepID=A0A9X4YGI6_9GAMM|nr:MULTISPECIES: 50S ribosomal protein L3 [Halomonas]MYL27590.1 50S ribosomal protein L3 [Halomonas utahensis]MYL75927.1 50S ribosomal protein L3 [Halomonas sp. 22501_18_FS]